MWTAMFQVGVFNPDPPFAPEGKAVARASDLKLRTQYRLLHTVKFWLGSVKTSGDILGGTKKTT
jgi:hypothetical protein